MVNFLILYLSQNTKFYSQCTKASDLSFSVENKIKVVIKISTVWIGLGFFDAIMIYEQVWLKPRNQAMVMGPHG